MLSLRPLLPNSSTKAALRRPGKAPTPGHGLTSSQAATARRPPCDANRAGHERPPIRILGTGIGAVYYREALPDRRAYGSK
jgi:hypothetical protein